MTDPLTWRGMLSAGFDPETGVRITDDVRDKALAALRHLDDAAGRGVRGAPGDDGMRVSMALAIANAETVETRGDLL